MTRRASLLKSALAFAPANWRPLSGLRSCLGLAVPIFLAAITGHTAWGMLGANGALNVALPGMNNTVSRRLQVMLSVAMGTALLAIMAVLVGQNVWATAVTMTVIATLLTLYGTGGAMNNSVALASTNTFIVLAGLQLPDTLALLSGLLILAGGLFQTFLLVVVWPFNPRVCERSAVVAVYHSLVQQLEHLPHIGTVPEGATLQEAWALLDEAKGGWHPEHEAMRQALQVAEGIRSALPGYLNADAQWRAQGPQAEAQASLVASHLSATLRQIEINIKHHKPPLHALPDELMVLPQFTSLPAPPVTKWLELIHSLLHLLRQSPTVLTQQEKEAGTSWKSLVAPPQSRPPASAIRFSIKYGLILGVTTLVVRLLDIPHGYWLVLTIAVVMRQEYVTTLTRGVGRFIGTLLGVLLATGLVWWLHPTQTVMSWWSLVGAFLAFALFPTGYAAFSAAITLYVVFAISASGAAEGVVVEVRLALTLLGGLLALVFYLMQPTWQSAGMPQALLEAVTAEAAYMEAVFRLRQRYSAKNLQAASEARYQARRLRLKAEAAVQASRLEPSRSRKAAAHPIDPATAAALLERLNVHAAKLLALYAQAAQDIPVSQREVEQIKRVSAQLLQDVQQFTGN